MASLKTPPKQLAASFGSRASTLCRCVLSVLAGCSVVMEGSAVPGEVEVPGNGDAGTVWMASPGGAQAGPGGATPGAPGGNSGGGGPISEPAGGLADAEAPGGGGQGALQCPLDGVYALDFQLDVLWQGTEVDFTIGSLPVIDKGAGTLSFLLLAQLHATSKGAKATARVCGTEVPDFGSNWLQERYAPRFDDAIWESSSMPRFPFDLDTVCLKPGAPCKLMSSPIHAQLGSKLDDPAGQWPASAAMAPVWPDHDGDFEPGVTAQLLGPESQDESDRPYDLPPIPLSLRRVAKMMMGLRMQLLLDLEMLGCDALGGATREARVDSRIVGCIAESAPLECSAEEIAFLDTNLPIWVVREGRIQGTRMEANADCAAARRAFR